MKLKGIEFSSKFLQLLKNKYYSKEENSIKVLRIRLF